MKDIDDRIAKEESKRRKEREKKLVKNKRVIEADEELENEDDNVKRRKLDTTMPEPTLTAKKNRGAIVKLVKSSFEKLPTPKHEKGKVLPTFANDTAKEMHILKADADAEAEEEEDDSRIISEQGQGLFESQAVKQSLPIPNPKNLKEINEIVFKDSLGRSITEECYKLIKSDYKRYRDEMFDVPLVQELDKELYAKVNKEVDFEFSKIEKTHEESINEYRLPKSFEVAESIIEILHSLHKRNEALANQLQLSDFEEQRFQKKQAFTSLMQELRDVELELAVERKKTSIEYRAIDRESKAISQKLAELEKRINSISGSSIKTNMYVV